ncbi:phage holin family protein [Paludifilum halophilum]|uniref:Holin n=1 Tax=Paludifilum halophilum TaxID=1642702 RepID=A0A235B1R8_9BACL|nr:phage holin family protein [Paludifilum halophilum]OYD06256.1 holin [Paludifilum halophilum]
METVLKTLVGIGAGIASFLWGGWSAALGSLLFFVATDYVTGVVAAAKEGQLSSQVGVYGIARKVGVFAIVALAHMVDQQLGDGHMFRDGTVAFYLANEALSIIENAGRIGVPIPPKVQEMIETLRRKGEKKNENQ